MKFHLFCMIVAVLADMCKARRTIEDLAVRNPQRRAVPVPFVKIEVRSEGCNDPGIATGTCGIAYIEVNEKDHSPHGRGHNVVIVDATTGAVLGTESFDTHGDGTAGNRLRDYLNGIHGYKIVLVAIQEDGSNHFPDAVDALTRVGATDPILIAYRASFALVGYTGEIKPPWISQQQAHSYQGPSEIFLSIPLTMNCLGVLGMENQVISDGQLSASTEWNAQLSSAQGRLHHPRSWSSGTNDVNQWYQVDLRSPNTRVAGVATQGRGDYPQWVTRYKLQYNNDEVNFHYYTEQGETADKEFVANTDQNTVVYHGLNPQVMARYIRFIILAFHGHISMRVEVYGCSDCNGPLGMQNGAISDGQLQASTEWDDSLSTPQGRLHYPRCWAARTSDVNQWYQIDLGSPYIRVTGTATQGRGDHPQWVTQYKLQYGNDGINFQFYREQGQQADKEFPGNSDQDTVVYHALNPSITARLVRFRILAWHGFISMRAELYGCPDQCLINQGCKNGATCVNLDEGYYRCDCISGYTGNYCETDIDECASNPCQNGATCDDLVGGYRCDCRPGYSGNNCETDVDECASNPCQNGATCVDLVESYRCDCRPGYSGNNCETVAG